MNNKYNKFLKRVDLVHNQVERERIKEQQAAKSRSKTIQQQNAKRFADYQRVLRAELEARWFAGVLSTSGAIAGTSIDPDAQAFITAAAITDPTQQSAINQLVVDLKGYNIWTKFKAIYPVVGGSASSHAVNLKTPGTFNLTFSTGWSHTSNGMTPSVAYADTSFNPLTQSLPRNSASMGVYNRTNTVITGGHGQRVSNNFEMFDPWSDNRVYGYINNGPSGYNEAVADSTGLIQVSRTTSTAIAISKNSTVNNGSQATTGDSNGNLWIGASNNGGTGNFFNNRQIAFFYIAEGFNNTEMQNNYTAVQAYQTTLSRQV